MSKDADLSFATVLDTSDYDKACDHIVNKTAETGALLEEEAAKLQAIVSVVPDINFDVMTEGIIGGAEGMKEAIGNAFAAIAHVINENSTEVEKLEQQYDKLREEVNMFQNVPSKSEHVKELKKQKTATKELIEARKQAIASAKEAEKTLEKEHKALIKSAIEKEKNANKTQTLRQRIKELENEAAELVNTAQQEGRVLDQTKGRYREIIEELGRLRDIRGDIQTAGNVFANDEAQIAGVIQGLSGLSGAFTVAQGAVGLFGSENEKLNEIMLKVQSLMAITMGLQQVQQVLNKDSTFSLVTLNAIKKLFNKNSEEAAEVIFQANFNVKSPIFTYTRKQHTSATQMHSKTSRSICVATFLFRKSVRVYAEFVLYFQCYFVAHRNSRNRRNKYQRKDDTEEKERNRISPDFVNAYPKNHL